MIFRTFLRALEIEVNPTLQTFHGYKMTEKGPKTFNQIARTLFAQDNTHGRFISYESYKTYRVSKKSAQRLKGYCSLNI